MNARPSDGYSTDDRLPWLETVEEEYQERPSIGRVVLLVVLALAILGAATAAYFWFQKQRGANGNGALIQAPAGDYKVQPDEPGGMKVEGQGDTVFSTSQGAATNGSINVGAMPEAPVQGTKAPAAADAPGTKNAKIAIPSAPTRGNIPEAADSTRPGPAPGSGSLIQLGAFPDEAGANRAWAQLSKRFGYLAPLGKSVERGDSNGRTVWRLRVNAGSNGQARDLCGRLKVAGENCFIAN